MQNTPLYGNEGQPCPGSDNGGVFTWEQTSDKTDMFARNEYTCTIPGTELVMTIEEDDKAFQCVDLAGNWSTVTTLEAAKQLCEQSARRPLRPEIYMGGGIASRFSFLPQAVLASTSTRTHRTCSW